MYADVFLRLRCELIPDSAGIPQIVCIAKHSDFFFLYIYIYNCNITRRFTKCFNILYVVYKENRWCSTKKKVACFYTLWHFKTTHRRAVIVVPWSRNVLHTVTISNWTVPELITTLTMNVCFIRAWLARFMHLSLSLFRSAALNGARRAREECWPSFRCVTSEWASFMRLPECHSHVTMNCEQDFGDGGLGVTLTLRLLMHGKVRARIVYKWTPRQRSALS